MNELIRFRPTRGPQHGASLSPRSRADLVIEQVERLAEEASTQDIASSTSPAFVRKVIEARAARRRFFDSELFADPAWDMLLELYALDGEQRRTSISKLSVGAAIPPTTALRWLDKLHSEGLIEREADRLDARRVWIKLSDEGVAAMTAYLGELAKGAIPL